MGKKPLYTIGHGNRKPEDFLSLLKKFGIEYIIDVRTVPYSKFNPAYNQNALSFLLETNGVKYVFMGDSIGGRPNDKSCYDSEDKVDYDVLKYKDFFLQGITRLKTAYAKEIPVAIMCSESKPCECHRSKLIGRILDEEEILLRHIDENGRLKTQGDIINEVNKGLSDTTLFPAEIKMNRTSRKSY